MAFFPAVRLDTFGGRKFRRAFAPYRLFFPFVWFFCICIDSLFGFWFVSGSLFGAWPRGVSVSRWGAPKAPFSGPLVTSYALDFWSNPAAERTRLNIKKSKAGHQWRQRRQCKDG